MYDDLFSLSDKPIAITETGFPAEDFSIMGGSLTFESNPAKQDRYITQLLAQADRRGFVFIINFVLRDYDALFDKTGGGDNNIAWRDTGLYDEDGHPRPALETWLAALARPYRGD